jgi:single-stranded-DNA-specific exonuclease
MSSVAPFAKPSDFPAVLRAFGARPLVACHNDADGLSAGAIMLRVLSRAGLEPEARIVGRGENAYSAAFAAEIAARRPGGLVIADLGVSAQPPGDVTPTVVIDHHVPTGRPAGALVVSGIDDDPIPTSSLLAYRCAEAAGLADDLLWLAALGIIGDMAESAGFPEMEAARRAYGVTSLRNAASLINAPRRTGSGNASPALSLLLQATGPKQALDGSLPETQALLDAKREVQDALAAARRTPPKIAGDVAIVMFSSPCQVHPLIAQQWRGRLKDRIVIAANAGFRPGYVHFAARTALDVDLIEFFAAHRPPGADEQYGSGHRAASGGALPFDIWNGFVRLLGFGRELEAPAGRVAA